MAEDKRPELGELVQNCAKEPIQIPGAIQDIGLFFSVDYTTFDILQVSENVKDALGVDAAEVLTVHKNLINFLNLDEQNVEGLKESGGPALCDISHFNTKHKHMLVFVHPSRFQDSVPASPESRLATLIVEAELLSNIDTVAYIQSMNKMLSRLNSFQLKLSGTSDLNAVCNLLVKEVQAVSNYDRIMLYEFDADWHGHVVAEETAQGIPITYLGIHFPASDIPPQARQLYTVNKFRMISDVNYKRVPLVPAFDPRTHSPTDLTHSVFRAVSPVHLEYLRNMEVRASFSISILVNDRLWGLVACHHLRAPKFLSHTIRSLCLSVGNASSAHIQNIINRKNEKELSAARVLLMDLENTLQKASWTGVNAITLQFDTLLKGFGADYGLISIMGETKILGTMDLREAPFTSAFLEWVNSERPSTVISTDSIIRTLPVFNKPELQNCLTSGLVFIPLSLLSPCFVAFYRLEQVFYVDWAGKEEDKIFVRQGEKSACLRPRNSFQVWTEEVRKRTLAWGDVTMETAKHTQQTLSRFVEMWRAEQLKAQIQQRDVLMAQLEQDKNHAEESNRLKSRFMATVSHEVRTPLNAIIGMLDMTLHTQLDNKQREYLTSVQFAADSLLRIVNDVLDISKIEAGKIEVANELFNICELVSDTAAIFRGTIEQKRLQYSVWQDPAIPQLVMGDSGKVRQILSNLLANAQKYTDNGSVSLRHSLVESTETTIVTEVSVTDTGVGIPADRFEAIFEPFEQADNSLSRRFGGAGLGLSICKQLSNAMGGKVSAQSVVGQGSTFSFSMKYNIAKNPHPLSPSGSIPPPDDIMTKTRPLRVLVVEDNELNQKVLVNILRRMGHETTIAWNGEEGVNAFFQANPPVDLVLMDLFMPIMDGITATRLIRARESLRTPIVAVTAQCLPGDKEVCLKAGMDAYLAKPVKTAILHETIIKVTSFGARDLPS